MHRGCWPVGSIRQSGHSVHALKKLESRIGSIFDGKKYLKTKRTKHKSLLAVPSLCLLRRRKRSRRIAAHVMASSWPEPTDVELEALSEERMLPLSSSCADLKLNLPQRFGGLIDNWKAKHWSQEHWIRNFGHLKFRLRPCVSLHHYGYAGPADDLVTLKEYLTSDAFQQKWVLFENDFDAERLELLNGFAVPELLAEIHGAPIFSAGRKDTGLGFHRHGAAWLAQLVGRKLWLLVPGGKRPPERPPWQYLTHRPKQLTCGVAHPGEVIFAVKDVSTALLEDGDAARLKSMNFDVSLPALSLAARSGRVEILDLLLERSSLEKDAPSMAIAAARSGHVAILSQLWKKGMTSFLDGYKLRDPAVEKQA
eukprot:Skav222906  [mRNA]  locus=scaffold1489:157772:159614:+ [translate_table: standard]